jgi:hypothetical protein
MNTRLILAAAILTAVLTGGCAAMQWAKEDASAELVSQDLMRCQQDAWHEARMNTWYYRPLGPVGGPFLPGRPFGLAYSPYYYDPFGDPYMEEARLTQFCMRNKGYELKPTEQAKSGSGSD